jgi:hypothetical protein
MKKRTIGAVLAATAATVIAPLLLFEVASAGASGVKHQSGQTGGDITIQSWIHAYPSDNVLSATDWACMKITGAIVDQGGGPTWANDSEFTAPLGMTGSSAVNAASKECTSATPAGGVVFVPPPVAGQYAAAKYKLTAVYGDFTLGGEKGDIYITYAGDYNLSGGPLVVGDVTVPEGLTADCMWDITGGSGAYAGLQGAGKCEANIATTYPYVWHVSTGQVWWSGASKAAGTY